MFFESYFQIGSKPQSAILPEIVEILVFEQNAVKSMVALTTKLALNTKDGVLLFHAE